jgi:hypothetical protein
MRPTISIVIAALLFAALSCSRDVHSYKITDEKKAFEEIKDRKGLTVDEGRLLYAAAIRSNMGQALGGKASGLVGKTVGEVIDEQRKLETDEKARSAEQERLAVEAKAKQDARAAELRGTLTLSVFRKLFVPSNPMGGRYSDYVSISCAYQNKSAKNIRAFTGEIAFTDLFGKEIFSSNVTISDPVKAGATGQWEGSIEFNQFIDSHRRLRDTELKDMKIVWSPKSIIFEDGSVIGEQPKTGA